MFQIDKIQFLQIGVQGENAALQLQIDMTSWVEKLPNDVTYHILFKPYNETTPVPMETGYADNILTWTVTLSATQNVGVGYTEVRAINSSGLVKKSKIIPTAVESSVSGTEASEPPASYQGWVNQVLGAASDAEAYARGTRGGSAVQSTDPAYHNNSLYYDGQAEMWATGGSGGTPSAINNAEYFAGQAEDSAEEAEAWATGGTSGTPGATNNAKYYAEHTESIIEAATTEAIAAATEAAVASATAEAAGYAEEAEAWATGGTEGTPSATNNSKYYSEQSASSATTSSQKADLAQAWATGGSGGTPSATNNAKYYRDSAAAIAAGDVIDDDAGAGDLNLTWSADKLSGLKSAFVDIEDNVDGVKPIFLIPGYIKTNTSPVNPSDVQTSSTYSYAVIPCSAGDEFIINGESSASAARLWAFVDSSNTVLTRADTPATGVNLRIVAPASTSYLVINSKNNGAMYKKRTMKKSSNISGIVGKEYAITYMANNLPIEMLYDNDYNTSFARLTVSQGMTKSTSRGFVVTLGALADIIDKTIIIHKELKSGYDFSTYRIRFNNGEWGNTNVIMAILHEIAPTTVAISIKQMFDAAVAGSVVSSDYSGNVQLQIYGNNDWDVSSIPTPFYSDFYFFNASDKNFVFSTKLMGLSKSPLEGKKINFLGDSYVANNGEPVTDTWEYKLAAKYNMTYRNYGINGNCMLLNDTGMWKRYTEMSDDADYIVVIGGTNDFNRQPELTLFRERMDGFIEDLVEKYPKGIIVFFTMWNCLDQAVPAVAETKTHEKKEYNDIIVEECKKYGIPVFDSWIHSGMRAWDGDFRTEYFQASDDRSHLNAKGHDRFLPIADAFMQTIG